MVRRSIRPDLNKPRRPDLRKGRPDSRPNNRNNEFEWPDFEDPLENHQPIWTDSPFEIGGGEGDIENFLTPTPIGYDVEIVRGTCEIGLRFTPEILFTRQPPIEIIYRIPGCREPEPIIPLPIPEPPDLPPEPPIWPGEMPPLGQTVEVYIPDALFDDESGFYDATGVECIHDWWPESKLAELTGSYRVPDRLSDGVRYVDWGYGFGIYQANRYLGYSRSNGDISGYGNSDFWQRFSPDSDRKLFVRWKVSGNWGLPYIVSGDSRWSRPETTFGRGHQFWVRRVTNTGLSSGYSISYEYSVSYQCCAGQRFRGTVAALNEALKSWPRIKIMAVYDGSSCLSVPAPPKFGPPPPPPPPMKNCPCQHNDRLLKDLLSRVQRIQLTVGADLFFDDKAKQLPQGKLPFAPERVIYPKARGDRKRHPLRNLVELLEFQIRQVDRAVGDLPITIKIKDADPSREGDQKVEAEFHSLGSALKEITELGIESGGDVDLQTLMLCRILYECGFIHQGSIQSQFILEAIADWLDFPVKYKTKKFPFAFNPRVGIELGKGFGEGQDQGDVPDTEAEFEKIAPKLLKETDTPIKVMELNPKQKTTLKDAIDEIQRLVRVAAAAAGQEATPENLDNLINVARLALRMDGLLRREDYRKAATQATKPQGG